MAEQTSRGDARRSMALLWGTYEAPSRGPKQGVSVPAIVAAGIALADAEGLEAVSMRKVAERVGRSAMSLYTYVPSKDELLDLMVDSVQGELRTGHDLSGGWRAAVEELAHDRWAFYERHPWVLHTAGRPTLGPNEIGQTEELLRIVDGLGLTGVEMSRTAGALLHFIGAAAAGVHAARSAEQETGLSDDEWWAARSAALDEVAPDFAGRFPVSSRMDAEEHAFDQLDRQAGDDTPYLVREALDTFEFGLARLLDGIEVLIESRRPKRGRRT